jgi:tetratricopeptide (TPR) repeat protein
MPWGALAVGERRGARARGDLQAVDGRARVLSDLGRFDEAIEALRPAIQARPCEARLWSALGVAVNKQGDGDNALTFFAEALRLDPRSASALYNRGGVLFDHGRLEAARADFTAARGLAARPADRAMIDLADAMLSLCRGDLAAGWGAYEARLSPHRPDAPVFDAPGQLWTPGAALEGAQLLVVAEQGLGDEIMFANLLPEVIDALGPSGRLTVAVDARLVELFRRSFPRARILAHATERREGRPHRHAPAVAERIDLWAPMASLPRRFRRRLADFPARPAYLAADPARVGHWRTWLGEGPPTAGLTWRSGKLHGERRRQYPTLDDWLPVLRTPGVRLVNLQYGDAAEELAAMAEAGGEALLQPPGLDLRNDIDDLAALCTALDLVVAVPNATAALAGACGAEVVMLGGPAAWPRLGTQGYPWYPRARSFAAAAFGDWTEPMRSAAAAVAALA